MLVYFIYRISSFVVGEIWLEPVIRTGCLSDRIILAENLLNVSLFRLRAVSP